MQVLDQLNFWVAKIKNYSDNSSFKKEAPGFKLPSDYFLYETYRLNYRQYQEDGILSAKEILEWTKPYLTQLSSVMEWGCGVARIIRHLPELCDNGTSITGIDINDKMIEWNKSNIPGIHFETIGYIPPTTLSGGKYDLVYAISVFTHIEADQQMNWVKEIHRLMATGGVFLFTTHGTAYDTKLSPHERRTLKDNGVVTTSYTQKGHRMMASYNDADRFKKLIQDYFSVLEFYSGKEYPDKIGGQDLWVVRKSC